MKKLEHILLAKDNEDYTLLFKRALQAANIDAGLQIVRDGQEAVDYLSGAEPYADRIKRINESYLLYPWLTVGTTGVPN